MTPEQISQAAELADSLVCGCGHPAGYWPIVLLMLERAGDHQRGSFYDAAPDASAAWVELVANFLNQADLIEHGGGIGWAWLTDNGELLLAFLREYGTDPDLWPDAATTQHVTDMPPAR